MNQVERIADQSDPDGDTVAQKKPGIAGIAGDDQQRRADAGRQRVVGGEGGFRRIGQHRPEDQGNARDGEGLKHGGRFRFSLFDPYHQRADREFEGAERQQIEDRGVGLAGEGEIEAEADNGTGRDGGKNGLRKSPQQQHQKPRPEQIELFLDPERPCVKQRLYRCGEIEITALLPEQNIRNGQDGGDQGSCEVFQMPGRKQQACRDEARGEGEEQRGKEPACPPDVEFLERKCSGLYLGPDQTRDQESADNEENVDADITAGGLRKSEMEQQHAKDGDAAESVYLR